MRACGTIRCCCCIFATAAPPSSCATRPSRPRSASELVMIQSLSRASRLAQGRRQLRRHGRHAGAGRPPPWSTSAPAARRPSAISSRPLSPRTISTRLPASAARSSARSRCSESLRAGVERAEDGGVAVVDAMRAPGRRGCASPSTASATPSGQRRDMGEGGVDRVRRDERHQRVAGQVGQRAPQRRLVRPAGRSPAAAAAPPRARARPRCPPARWPGRAAG